MYSLKSVKVLALIFIAAQFALGATHTVAKDGSGEFTSVKAAVKAAGPNDIIEILDASVYAEQVTIDSTKNGLTLKGTLAQKPTIQWCDKLATNPSTCKEAQDTTISDAFEKAGTYFDQNGALRVLHARGITIDNIIIDGGGAAPFYHPSVWSGPGCSGNANDLFSGNAALDLWIAGDISIRNCDIQNAYFGIYVKDRNVRGIFANPNPSDIARYNIIPLSGFGKTGNHIFENNRIHNNSWGMFFESSWDLGSVIRYNLIYDNHHANSALATQVKGMGSEGQHQVGGAILFKDVPLSPVAIYNNTFLHNTMNIAGQWQAGASYLLFNNIFGAPLSLWNVWRNGDGKGFDDPSMFAMDVALITRLKHNLYAAMFDTIVNNVYVGVQAPDPATHQNVQSVQQNLKVMQPVVMNDFRNMETGGYFTLTMPYSTGNVDTVVFIKNNQVISPGALLLGAQNNPFPADADNRWLEVKFKSTNPASPDFLVPDWSDSTSLKFIVNQGWPDAGVTNADGSIADIGAIPFSKIQKDEFSIKPTMPVVINGSLATVSFNLYKIAGNLKNPVIKYVRWLKDLPRDTITGDNWGHQVNTGNVLDVSRPGVTTTPTIPATPLQVGLNTLVFTVQQTGKYGFFEIVIQGTGSDGQTVSTDVGFLPFRQLKNIFSVKLYPIDKPISPANEIKSAQVGVPVQLQIVPLTVDKLAITNGTVTDVSVSLASPYDLTDTTGKKMESVNVPLTGYTVPVVFTKIPNQGWDVITANGVYRPANASTTGGEAIMGTSDKITILPGAPAQVKFQDPPSGGSAKVSPGSFYNVSVEVLDKYGNRVITTADVKLESKDPDKGIVKAPATVKSNDTGIALFQVTPTDGANQGDTFHLAATLVINGNVDNAKMVVDKRARFFIFYPADLGGPQNLNDSLVGYVGDRLPVVISESSTNGLVPDSGYLNGKFVVTHNTALQIFANATDVTPKDTFTLMNGKDTIWVTGVMKLSGEVLTVSTPSGTGVKTGTRSNIYFNFKLVSINHGIYYSDNGFGKVDKLELFYDQNIDSTKIPDSLQLYWPDNSSNLRVVKKDPTNMILDLQNQKHLTVKLPAPFPEAITTFTSTNQLGTAYFMQGTTILHFGFSIFDGVGPLLASATLMERMNQTGNDTMLVRFTEIVPSDSLKGKSLTLIKNGSPVSLNILSSSHAGGDTLKIVVQNAGANSPAGGDSLKINSAGPVRDQYGNAANPANRPVVIALRSIPADVDSGIYKDVDGDGIVDNAIIHFKKRVNLANLQMVFKWRGNSSAQLNSSKFTYGADSSTVIVNLANAFTVSTMGWTDQDMSVTVTYTDFPGQVRTGGVVDRAAPVLKTAELHPGKGSADGTWSKDELLVTFSEQVSTTINPDKTPYKFFKTKIGGTEYQVQLSSAKIVNGGLGYSYQIDTIIGPYPSTGDSVQIDGDTPIISDAIGNFQTAKGNLKVALTVTAPKVDTMIVKLGPNPFRPVQGEKIKVIIDPLVKVPESVHLVMKFEIYDQLGNILYKDNGKESDNNNTKFTFEWNGRNLDGRNVGMGSYLLVIKGRDAISGKTLPTTQKMIGIIR